METLRNSIGAKIVVLIGIMTLLILSGMVVYYAKSQESLMLLQHRKSVEDLANYVSKGLETVMLTGNAEMAQDFGESLTGGTIIQEFFILRTDGAKAFQDNKTIHDVNAHMNLEMFKPRGVEQTIRILEETHPPLVEVLETHGLVSYPTQVGDTVHLTFLVPILNKVQCQGCHGDQDAVRGVLKLSTSLEAMHKMRVDIKIHAMRVLMVAIILSLLGIYFLVHLIVVRPVHAISAAMVQVANGNYGLSVPVVGGDELSIMAKQFNRMSIEVQKNHYVINQERNKLTTIIYGAREAIVVTDDQDKVVLVNPSAERLLGKSFEKIVQEGFFQLVDDPDYINKFLRKHGMDVPETLVYKERVLNFYAVVIANEQGKKIGSAALIRDITAEKKLEEQLREMSYTDKLTGLRNRRWMEQSINNELSRANRHNVPLSLLFFDVDHFKLFNDTHGHDLGDRVLEQLGALAIQNFRASDFPCRYGGEEFCVILTNTHAEGAKTVAETFRKSVETMLVETLQVTITIGVASYPEAAVQTPEELLKLADTALYEGKRLGRNRVVLWKDLPEG